jgi:hypothetical protein
MTRATLPPPPLARKTRGFEMKQNVLNGCPGSETLARRWRSVQRAAGRGEPRVGVAVNPSSGVGSRTRIRCRTR